jgi:hypothetical protein
MNVEKLWPSICIIVSNFRQSKQKLYFRFFQILSIVLNIKIKPSYSDFIDRISLQDYVKKAFQIHELWPNAKMATSSPVLWGKHFWALLHTVSRSYLNSRDYIFRRFLILYTYILPCQTCKKDFLKLIQTFKSYNQTKIGYITYISKLHNVVNFKIKSKNKTNKTIQTLNIKKFTDAVKAKPRSSCGCGG